MKELLALFLFSGGILIALSVPLVLGRVRPNGWYGFKTPETLADPQIWYAANEYAARRMMWLGFAVIAASSGLYFMPKLGVGGYGAAMGGLVLGGVLVAMLRSYSYLRRIVGTRDRQT